MTWETLTVSEAKDRHEHIADLEFAGELLHVNEDGLYIEIMVSEFRVQVFNEETHFTSLEAAKAFLLSEMEEEVGTARPETARDLKIGDRIWIFDVNKRVYETDKFGRRHGGPIYRHHWVPHVINGETSRSWLYGPEFSPSKLAKNAKENPRNGIVFSEAALEDAIWSNSVRYRLANEIDKADVSQLRRIAEILNYSE